MRKKKFWLPWVSLAIIVWQILSCMQEPSLNHICLAAINTGIVLLASVVANLKWVDAGGKKMTFQIAKFVFGLIFWVSLSIFCQFKPISLMLAIRLLASLYCLPLLFCIGLGYLCQWATKWKNGKPTQKKIAIVVLSLIN